MATPLIAYVPYAAAAYCTAKVAAHVWPALRSQLGSAANYSTMHGADGSDPMADRLASDCSGQEGIVDSFASNPYTRNAPPYCYNIDNNTIEGDGPLDGISPPQTTVALWTDEDGTQLATINVSGDNSITIPLCSSVDDELPPPPHKVTPPGTPQPPRTPPRGAPPGVRPPGRPQPPPDLCGRRTGRSTPQFAYASPCGPDAANRINAKRLRWG